MEAKALNSREHRENGKRENAASGIGNCGEMLRLGSPAWCLWAFSLVGVAAGLWLWNGLGREFGLGKDAGDVDRGAAYVTFGLLVLTVVLELALSPR